jgi:biotin transporter BioY
MDSFGAHLMGIGKDAPDAVKFPTSYVLATLGVATVVVYSIGWIVLRLVPDPKAPARPQPAAKASGRWAARGWDRFWFWFFVVHIVSARAWAEGPALSAPCTSRGMATLHVHIGRSMRLPLP